MKNKKIYQGRKFINDIPSLRSVGWRVWLNDENVYHGEFHIANSFSYVVIHSAEDDNNLMNFIRKIEIITNNIDSLLSVFGKKKESIYYRQWLNDINSPFTGSLAWGIDKNEWKCLTYFELASCNDKIRIISDGISYDKSFSKQLKTIKLELDKLIASAHKLTGN